MCQAFDDGGFTHARFADQYGVIFSAALQHLNGAADFVVAADNGVKFTVAGALGQVERVFFQRIALVFGISIVHVLSSSYRVNCGIDILFGRAGFFQDFAGRIVLLHQSKQEKFAGDIGIAAFGCRFVHQVQHRLQFAAGHNVAALAGHFRQAV